VAAASVSNQAACQIANEGKKEGKRQSKGEPFAGLAVKFRTSFNHLSFQQPRWRKRSEGTVVPVSESDNIPLSVQHHRRHRYTATNTNFTSRV